MITLTPIELQSIINAALIEIARHPESYQTAGPKTKQIYRWLTAIGWDEPEKPAIMIDELPF